MAANEKDTIYIDIDDEITGIIDKVRSSKGKIVALVLPKRASVFQSIVNMKLLKRAADDSKKHLVLITTEAGLLPLAGAAGIHVAKTLTSRPEIPSAPAAPNDDMDEAIEEVPDEPEEITVDNAGETPVGELAGIGTGAAAAKDADVETVELDNEDTPEVDEAPVAKKPATAGKKDKKLAVPNFERFRLWLIIGGVALVVLIIGMIAATIVLPKATIAIDTDATAVSVDDNLVLSTTAKSVRLSSSTLPAKVAKQQKTYTQQAPATGQKNNGNKAQGTVKMVATACVPFPDNGPATVPAGTGVSINGQTFITQEATTFSEFGKPKGSCATYSANNSTAIVAQSGGSNFNVDNTSISVAGRKDVSGTGSASGGTDNIVTVVTQTDINNAKSKINTSDSSVKSALQSQLKGDNYFPVDGTFNAGTPTATNSADVGDAASTVTVTETVNYVMFGVHEDDLKAIIDNNIKDKIDTSKQKILSEGIDEAKFTATNVNDTEAQVTMSTNATAGPELDIDSIKADAAGKKSGEVKQQLESNPDVTSVNVKLSPFWVTSVPKKTSKITVTVAKPKPAANNSNANNP
jgi:hypothetical protein